MNPRRIYIAARGLAGALVDLAVGTAKLVAGYGDEHHARNRYR